MSHATRRMTGVRHFGWSSFLCLPGRFNRELLWRIILLWACSAGIACQGQSSPPAAVHAPAPSFTTATTSQERLIGLAVKMESTIAERRARFLDKQADPAGKERGKPIPAGPSAKTQNEEDQKYSAWFEKKVLASYQGMLTPPETADPKVVQFLSESIPALIQDGKADFPDLDKRGKALLAGKHRDPHLLFVCSFVASRLKQDKEAQALLLEAGNGLLASKGTKIPLAMARINLGQMELKQAGPTATTKKWFDLAMTSLLDAVQAGEFASGEEVFADRLFRKIIASASSSTIGYGWDTLWTKAKTRKNLTPWLRYMIQGEAEIKLAWKARGYEWASHVTPEGWRDFKIHMQNAQAALTEAWKLRPDLPQAASEMITVATADITDTRESARAWFDRAVAAQLDYTPAYDAMLSHLDPRWHGSHTEKMLFARECLATGRFDTAVPLYYLTALHMMGEEYPNDTWRAVYRQPAVHQELEQLFTNYFKNPSRYANPVALHTHQATAEAWCGNYDRAKELLAKLPADAPFDRRILSWNLGREGFEAEVRAFTGPQKDTLIKAEGLSLKFKFSQAVPLFIQAMDASKDDHAVYNYLRDRIAWMCMGGAEDDIGSDSIRLPSQHLAARNNHLEVLEFLLDHGADVNAVIDDSWTPLHLAIRYGSSEGVRMLMDHGADVRLTPKQNSSPLTVALNYKLMKIVPLLLQKGADVNYNQHGSTPLFAAALADNYEGVEMMLKLGATPDLHSNRSGMTALCIAAEKNYPRIAKLLLEKGANPNYVSESSGYTPLHYAAYYGSTDCVRLLLEHGARRDAKLKKTGSTPLALAQHQKHEAAVKLLSESAGAPTGN